MQTRSKAFASLASFCFTLLHLSFSFKVPLRPLEAWLPPPSLLSPPSARSAQLRWPRPTPTADSPARSGVPTTGCMEVSHFVKSRIVSCLPSRARGRPCMFRLDRQKLSPGRTELTRSCRTHRRLALRAQQARRDGLDDLFHLRVLRLQARRSGTDRRHLHAGQRVWELVVRYRGCDLHQRRGLRQRTLHRRTMVSADRQDLSSLKSVR
jgi:hypothetical protein